MDKKHPHHDQSMWKGAPSAIFKHAEFLRNNPTEAEKLLWVELKKEPFKKYHFRRQHPIHLFIADFYCHQLNLIIEIDGNYHDSQGQQTRDQSRTDLLEFQGMTLIRYGNTEVIKNMDYVLKDIAMFLNS